MERGVRAGLGLAFLGIAIAIGTWLVPPDKIAYSIKFALIVIALLSGVIGLILLIRACGRKYERGSISRDKIRIFLAHADGYRGAIDGVKEENRHRHIVSSDICKLSSNERSFAFGIDNDNIGKPLHNARIEVLYHGQVPISVMRTHLDEEGHHWHEYMAGTQYFYEFRKPINARWAHSWGSLIVKFSEPAEYEFKLTAISDELTGNPLVSTLRVVVPSSVFARTLATPDTQDSSTPVN